MKKWAALFLILVLLISVLPVEAETYYVYTANGQTLNLRSPADNSIIGRIPYGTRLETDDDLSTEKAAYVSYGGKSGYVKWEFLVKDPPPVKGSGKSTQASPAPTPAVQLPEDGEGQVTIQALNASVQYQPDGSRFSAVSYDTPRELIITADTEGKRPAYWVINGIRYDFEPHVPTTLTINDAQESMTIEAVPQKGSPYTLISPEEIQAARTGEPLVVQAIHAKLCHLTAKDYGKGGWLDSFDFTNDYLNRATNKQENGGQITTRIRATIPKNRKILYWKFDDTQIKFSTDVTEFIVRTLNVSKTYEPVFNGDPVKAAGTANPQPKPTAKPQPNPTAKPQPKPTAKPQSNPTAKPQPNLTAVPKDPSSNSNPAAVTPKPTGVPTAQSVATPQPTAYNTRPSAAPNTQPPATPQPTAYNTRPSAAPQPTDVPNTRPTATPGSNTRPTPTPGSNTRPTPTPGSNTRPTPTPGSNTRPTPTAAPETYTINCSGCSFTGGGYTNASSGTVPAGTTVSFYGGLYVSRWTINGTDLQKRDGSGYNNTNPLSYTVNRNLTVVCHQSSAPETYTINCSGCTFTGGGYTNATSGTVPAGTTVSFYGGLYVSRWTINGTDLQKRDGSGYNDSNPLSYTVNRNLTVVCHQ